MKKIYVINQGADRRWHVKREGGDLIAICPNYKKAERVVVGLVLIQKLKQTEEPGGKPAISVVKTAATPDQRAQMDGVLGAQPRFPLDRGPTDQERALIRLATALSEHLPAEHQNKIARRMIESFASLDDQGFDPQRIDFLLCALIEIVDQLPAEYIRGARRDTQRARERIEGGWRP